MRRPLDAEWAGGQRSSDPAAHIKVQIINQRLAERLWIWNGPDREGNSWRTVCGLPMDGERLRRAEEVDDQTVTNPAEVGRQIQQPK